MSLGPSTGETWERVWPALNQIADDLYAELEQRVSDAMIAAGEDHKLTPLFLIRVEQVAYGINSQAHRAKEQS
jgi:hypothetical protein